MDMSRATRHGMFCKQVILMSTASTILTLVAQSRLRLMTPWTSAKE